MNDIATKTDLNNLEEVLKTNLEIRLKTDLGEVRSGLQGEMQDMKSELRAEMQDMRTELRTEMQDMKIELRTEMQEMKIELRTEMQEMRSELKADFGTVMIQNEQTHGRLDAILAYIQSMIDVPPRLASLEVQAEQERLRGDVHRLELKALRHDLNDHTRRPHPAQ